MHNSPEIANCDYCQWRSQYLYGWYQATGDRATRTSLPLYRLAPNPAMRSDYCCNHPNSTDFAPEDEKSYRSACVRANPSGQCPGYQPSLVTMIARMFGLRRKARLRDVTGVGKESPDGDGGKAK